MQALVTGAAGFVGSRLVDVLLESGWTVRAFDLGRRGPDRAGLEFIEGDIRDAGLVGRAVAGVDVVFHLAAALGAARLGEEGFRAVNEGGTRTVLETARAQGVKRAVHFSSAGVLGHVAENVPADESHALDPRDAYDRTKLLGEQAAREIGRQGLEVVVVRPGWAYGPGDRRTFKLIRSIARRRFLLVGKGAALQTPVFVEDLAQGALLAALKGRAGEVYNLAGAEAFSVRAMTEAIAAACGRRLPRLRVPLGPTRLLAAVLGGAFGLLGKEAPLNPSRLAFFLHPKPLDIGKARAELGYAPKTDFADGLALTVAWGRRAGWLS
jgi:nucleoside-diphosphate-sugar epimerase